MTCVCQWVAVRRVRRLSNFHKQCNGYVYIKHRFCTSATLLMTLSFSERPFHVASYIWIGFFEICRMINIPIKHYKTVLPTSKVVLHGIEVDSVQFSFPRINCQHFAPSSLQCQHAKRLHCVRSSPWLGPSSFPAESFRLAEHFVVAS